jgi:hypothetical protein
LPGGLESDNSNEVGFDVTEGKDIQYGKVSYSNIGWNSIFFKQNYASTPAIIFGCPTNYNSAVYMSNKVKKDAENRFSFQYTPWTYLGVTTLSKEESIPYLIMNKGNYDFGKLKAKANTVDINPAWTQVTFPEAFDTIPVVFVTQLISSNTDPTGIRIRNVSKTGFEAKIQKESKVSTVLNPETVSYVAITQGTGTIDNKTIIVGKTVNAPVSISAFSNITFGDTLTNPLFISQMQTCNDDTVTATLRCQAVYSSYARVFKQREKSLGYTTAANEDAGWIVLEQGIINTGVKTVKNKTLKIMPNPVSDYLCINKAYTGKLKIYIYNMHGYLVKYGEIDSDKIDVKELPSGFYLIKTADNESAKFVKL